jgi:hypothetical protein
MQVRGWEETSCDQKCFGLLINLVGGSEHVFFPYIGNVIIPTDFHSMIFQRGRSTTKQQPLVSTSPWMMQGGFLQVSVPQVRACS